MIRVAYVIGEYPPEERKRREDVALSYASSEVEVGIISVPATPYLHGLTPAEVAMAATPFIHAFREAERQGYDAVVPLGFLDLGVDGGKSAVDIPVVGPCEAALHVASLVGDRFGAIVYHDSLIPMTRAIVARYGMGDWVAGYRSSGLDLPDIAAHHDELVTNFVAAARSLIEREGANVIIPMGITQCPVHIKPDWLQRELGVPVVEGIGAPIRLAALLAGLGLKASRVRWPKSPTVS
uniref:Hydantoin racemase n=1 Tax=uncultured bacterium 5E7 TaxID=1701324 RepID=A0A0N9HMW1_9BACT|nr:hydantoin racemase [uncultured bacterium 5E7]